jgi:hypothetical protein
MHSLGRTKVPDLLAWLYGETSWDWPSKPQIFEQKILASARAGIDRTLARLLNLPPGDVRRVGAGCRIDSLRKNQKAI